MAFSSLSIGLVNHLQILEQPLHKEREFLFRCSKRVLLANNSTLKSKIIHKKTQFAIISKGINYKSIGIITKLDCTITTNSTTEETTKMKVSEIKERYRKWIWKGQYSINYFVSSSSDIDDSEKLQSSSSLNPRPPLLLVHGFGASIPHWRRNIKTLAKNYTVYAIDLLGFGASDKPAGFSYTMETWAQLILDFIDEIVEKPTVIIGNSVGSLACLIAASESKETLVRGLVLLNCSGGMNNKAIVDDWRIKLLLPLLWLIDFLLKQRGIASAIFERVRQRDNLRNILMSVYANKEAVDEELVEIIMEPTSDPGALDAFVSIVTGPPGPSPIQLVPKISSKPVLVLWGNQDPFTPLDGPIGKYFTSLPPQLRNLSLFVLEGVGHCPHDDRPELVHEKLLDWLAQLPPLLVPSSLASESLPCVDP